MYKSYKGTRSGVPFRHVRIRDNDWSGGQVLHPQQQKDYFLVLLDE